MKLISAQGAAVLAQALYLSNLLLVPGLSWLGLWYLLSRYGHLQKRYRFHLLRAMQLSVLSGVLLLVLPGLYLLALFQDDGSWLVVILYFVCAHAACVLVGVLNLARAMSEKLPLF